MKDFLMTFWQIVIGESVGDIIAYRRYLKEQEQQEEDETGE